MFPTNDNIFPFSDSGNDDLCQNDKVCCEEQDIEKPPPPTPPQPPKPTQPPSNDY